MLIYLCTVSSLLPKPVLPHSLLLFCFPADNHSPDPGAGRPVWCGVTPPNVHRHNSRRSARGQARTVQALLPGLGLQA